MGNWDDKTAEVEMLRARIRGLEGALREICDSWDNPPPAARMDVRYQDAVRLARAALEADRPATTVVTLSQIEAAFPFGVWRLKSGPPWHKAFVAAQTPSFIRLSPTEIDEALQRVCERCDGEGEYPFAPVAPHTPNPCPTCHGTGKAEWQLYEFVTGLVKGLPAKP